MSGERRVTGLSAGSKPSPWLWVQTPRPAPPFKSPQPTLSRAQRLSAHGCPLLDTGEMEAAAGTGLRWRWGRWRWRPTQP